MGFFSSGDDSAVEQGVITTTGPGGQVADPDGSPQWWQDDFYGGGWSPEDIAAMKAGSHSSGMIGGSGAGALGYNAVGDAARNWHLGGSYKPDASAFAKSDGLAAGGWGSQQIGAARGLGGYSDNSGQIGAARQWGAGARGQLQQGLTDLWGRAQGRDSVVARQAQVEREKMQAGLRSQLASMRGGASPAAQRAALYAQSGMGQQMAGDVAARKAAEQQSALAAYMQGAAGVRAGDMQAQGLETGLEGQRQKFELGREAAAQGWGSMSLQDKWQQEAAARELEKLKAGVHGSALDRLSSEEMARLAAQAGIQGIREGKKSNVMDYVQTLVPVGLKMGEAALSYASKPTGGA